MALYLQNSLSLNFVNNSFKLLVFSDLHFDYLNQTCHNVITNNYTCDNSNTSHYMNLVIEKEKPNLIVLLGDNTDWDSHNTSFSIHQFIKPIIQSNIPWTTVLGNHDEQGTIDRKDLIDIYNNLENFIQIKPIPNIHGYGNHYLTVNDFILWFFDSGDYVYYHNKSLGYDWIHKNQIQWFLDNPLRKNNGLAFSYSFNRI